MVIRAIRVVPASVAVEACSVVVDAAALFCASPVAYGSCVVAAATSGQHCCCHA